MFSTFAQAVREATFSPGYKTNLVQGTVETTISYVAQAFRSSDREDPRLDRDGKTCFLLQEQWRGYKNTDGNTKKQKALPASVLRKMNELSTTPWEVAVTHLLILGLFFAMRSCEYLETRYPEESRRTRILRIKNIKFKKDGKILPHSSSEEILKSAELIIITFEFQKNDWRNHTVHMFSSGDILLCPVIIGTKIVKRVIAIPGSNDDSKICMFLTEDGKITHINSAQVLPRLRATVQIMGKDKLGFSEDDVGLHSLRAGGAMAMFLSGVPTIIIMRIGRWSSEAFLEYIREQVESFTFGVSKKMIRFEHFHTLNAEQCQDQQELENIFIEDKVSGNDTVPIEHKIRFSGLSLDA